MHRGFQVFPSMSFPFLRRSASATCCERIAFGSRVAARKMFLGQTAPGNFRHPNGSQRIPMDPNGSQWIPMDPVLRCLNPTLQTLHGMVKGKDLHWGTISGCKDWEMGLTRRVGSRLKTRKRRQTILVNVTMCFFYEITNLCKQYQPLPECHDFV